MPSSRYSIQVNINPQAQPEGTAPISDLQPPTTPSTSFVSLKTLKYGAIALAAQQTVKRVGAYAINNIGNVSGNYDLQNRINQNISLVKRLINPIEIATTLIDFSIKNKNQEINREYNLFVNGNLTNGGR